MPTYEHLMTTSSIKLYGRVMNDLTYNYAAGNYGDMTGDGNNFLRSQLAAANPCFAKIYAFSFEGAVYVLPRPTIFLVHTGGTPCDGTNRTSMDVSGVAAREWEFAKSVGGDLSYWIYEKGDFSLRLETEAGPLEQILLAAALRSGADIADRSGANVGIRSGANVSGANVSGANVSGANVSGANVRNR
jgi:uncharacterized protein YjbI with pentapeptide repeats